MTTIIIRAHSVPDFFDCAYRWYAKNVRRMRNPTTSNAQLGTAIHKATTVYDSALVEEREAEIEEATDELVNTLHYPERDVEWDVPASKLEPIGLALVKKYCNDFAGRQHYVAVEAFCESLRIRWDDIGIVLELTGTTDRVRRDAKGLGISDLKSGKNAVKADGTVPTKAHHLQIGIYELLAENVLGQPMTGPGRIVGLQTNSKARVAYADVPGARQAIVGTPESPGALDTMARMIKAGTFPGNPSSMMCHEKYCPAYKVCHWRK